MFRWRPGRSVPVLEDYVVPVEPVTTVLDALRSVRWHSDPTLTLRHSCSHASCGTCGVRVNGVERLGCVTRLADLPDGPVTVEPIANAPVVSDLVVDVSDLFRRLEAVDRPLVRRSEPPGRGQRLEDCVECGLCVSACPVAATDGDYLGPAALGAAWRAVAEPRGADPGTALGLADADQGSWRCHLSFACTDVCPVDADPAAGIMRLRGVLVRGRLARAGRRPGRRVRS